MIAKHSLAIILVRGGQKECYSEEKKTKTTTTNKHNSLMSGKGVKSISKVSFMARTSEKELSMRVLEDKLLLIVVDIGIFNV